MAGVGLGSGDFGSSYSQLLLGFSPPPGGFLIVVSDLSDLCRRMAGKWWNCRVCYTFVPKGCLVCPQCGNLHDSAMASHQSSAANPIHSYNVASHGKGKGKGKGKGTEGGKGKGHTPKAGAKGVGAVPVWDSYYQCYVYSVVSAPLEQSMEAVGAAGGKKDGPSSWRSKRSEDARMAREERMKGDEMSDSPSAAELRLSLSEVQSSISALKDHKSPQVNAAREALQSDKTSLMHQITELKSLPDQLKTLEGALEKKKEARELAVEAATLAAARVTKMEGEITSLQTQVSNVRSAIAAKRAEEAEKARLEAAQSAASSTPSGPAFNGADAHSQLPPGNGTNTLTGNHVQFLIGLAQLLPTAQASNFMECMGMMEPFMRAAGVTPGVIPMYYGTPVTPPSSGHPSSGAVPPTPASHIAAGGPPSAGAFPAAVGMVPASTETPVPEGRVGRTLRAHPSEESVISRGSRAGSRRRMRCKTVDPCMGRSVSPLWADRARMDDG